MVLVKVDKKGKSVGKMLLFYSRIRIVVETLSSLVTPDFKRDKIFISPLLTELGVL